MSKVKSVRGWTFCSTENCYNEKEYNNSNTGRLKYCLFCRIENNKTEGGK